MDILEIETEYKGLYYPMQKVDGSRWVVLGAASYSWWDKGSGNTKGKILPRHLPLNRAPRLQAISFIRWVSHIYHMISDGRPYYGWLPPSFHDKPAFLQIHYDADDPIHKFLEPDSWAIFENRKKLAQWYNAPHTKTIRMQLVRATATNAQQWAIFERKHLAQEALVIQDMILSDPNTDHYTEHLAYFPADWKMKYAHIALQGNFTILDELADKNPYRFFTKVEL